MWNAGKFHKGISGWYVYVTSTAPTWYVTAGLPSGVSAAGGALPGALPALQLTVALALDDTQTCAEGLPGRAWISLRTSVCTAAADGVTGDPTAAGPVIRYCAPVRAA